MVKEAFRSRAARAAAELALVRIITHYGELPEFVVLGGLVPELLCSNAHVAHAGTTDVDVQVDLEIAHGSVNAARLEQALHAADFRPDDERVWRWVSREQAVRMVVKFELLADLDDTPAGVTVRFDGCNALGAANLRGTGFAARDRVIRQLTAIDHGETRQVQVYITGLAGFLLAKAAAAHSRRKSKDWYDIAFVLLHNDDGGPLAAAHAVISSFASDVAGDAMTALYDLYANFADPDTQGPAAYVEQLLIDHPGFDATESAADAVTAVTLFCERLGVAAPR